jgi:signal transduction histidine kinase
LLAFLLTIWGLFLIGNPCVAQTKVADSIRKEIADLDKNDPHYLDQKAGALGTLLQSVKYSDPEYALILCDSLFDVFMQLDDTMRAYEAKYRYKAGIYDLRGQSDSLLLMLESYAESLTTIKKSDGYVYIDIGNVYFGFGMFGLATENYNRAEEIFRREKNLSGLCTIYNNHAQMFMGSILVADSALKWLRRSYDVRADELKDEVLSHESYYLMSIVHRQIHQYDSAKTLLWRVIDDIESGAVDKHTDHIALRQEFSGAYTAMGNICTALDQKDSAEYYFSAGEKLYTESGYNNRLPGLYNAWSRFYMKMKDASKSWHYIKKTEEFTSADNPNAMMTLYQLYADWYEWQGQTMEMYEYRLKYYHISDSLQASNSKEQTMVVASRVLQIQDKARIEQQRAEILQRDLEAEIAERKIARILIAVIALLIIVALAIWSVIQVRRKNALIVKYNKELESANATKEQFLSVISHDLRSPFNALIGMSDLLKENARSGNYTDVERSAEQINEASRKAYILLDNLMQWVSVQKENIVVKKEWASASDLIDDVIFLLKEQSLSRNITIEKNITVAKLFTDKTLFQVVLRNLLSNAVKYTPSGGKIVIRCATHQDNLQLVVEDNGNGFPKSELETLSSKEQGVAVAKKAGGLGLVLVRQFVQLMGGSLTAENATGSGARVTVILPDSTDGYSASEQITPEEEQMPLSDAEKVMLRTTLARLSNYELFDATEIRELIEQPLPGETKNITEWRKNLLQSVYLADDIRYSELIRSAKE